MPPKSTNTANGSVSKSANSTVAADGQPKAKRKRVRNRKRGKAAKQESSSDDDDSSSSEDSDDDSDASKSAKASAKVVKKVAQGSAPVASTSKLPASTAKPASSAAKASMTNGKGKAVAKADSDDSDADSDDSSASSSSSVSSSSSSSFLSSSSDEETSRKTRRKNAQQQRAQLQQHNQQLQAQQSYAAANGQSDYADSRGRAPDPHSIETRPARRPSPQRQPSPPYLTFGIDAEAQAKAQRKAAGRPILWGLLPSDRSEAAQRMTDAEIDAREDKAYAIWRAYYVSRMVARFGGSLDDIRKKEGKDLSNNRLEMLISSIAGGADHFTSKDGQGVWRTTDGKAGEREIGLEALDRAERSSKGGEASDNSDEEMAVA